MSYYAETYLVGAHWFGDQFPKRLTFSGIFWVLPMNYSLYEKTMLVTFAIAFKTHLIYSSSVNWKVPDKYLFSGLLFWIFVSIYWGSYADSNGIYFAVW